MTQIDPTWPVPLDPATENVWGPPLLEALNEMVAQGNASDLEINGRLSPASLGLSNKLLTRFADGFFGQRQELTGVDDTVMPYHSVVATSLTGTDVGGATAGYQLHRLPGGGAAANREFLAIEASGDLATVPGFKISPWASGTGQLRPVSFWDGTHEIFRIVNEGGTGALRIGDAGRITLQDIATTARTVILMQRNGTYGDQRRVYSSTAATRAYIFLSKNRGTIAAPTGVGSGDTLGDIVFGSTASGAEKTGGYIRGVTKQAWAYDSAHGTKVQVAVAPVGAASPVVQAEVDEPEVVNDTGMLLRVDRDGVRALARVRVGAPDSGGVGKRALVVDNAAV